MTRNTRQSSSLSDYLQLLASLSPQLTRLVPRDWGLYQGQVLLCHGLSGTLNNLKMKKYFLVIFSCFELTLAGRVVTSS